MSRDTPPYRHALGAALLVLVGYLVTLAPTVTFWDAGELIAAARSLGIPHPPGTPLWVMLAHVWGMVLPFGDYAWRLNLLSAVAGSLAAGCWYLVGHALATRSDREAPRWTAHGAGLAAALLTSFGFTTWQNAVEAEVYSVAMVTIAAAAWVAVRWCQRREARTGARLLLVLLYFGAISIGNHLLALLIGPAVVALLVMQSWRAPLGDRTARRTEQARIAVVAATWLLLIALGLGSTSLTLLTGGLVIAAGGLAIQRRQLAFVAAALGIVLIGVTPYLFLYFRARQGPYLNEADPATWDALLAVIRRAQYPIRTPLDDPTVFHGPGNPGRTLAILGYQLANYAQYFDWQWARTLGDGAFTSAPRLAVTFVVLFLGASGARAAWRRDRAGFWFLATGFVVTGLGLVLYMNFKPGPSIGWNRWTTMTDHEVRERDYFFVASFVVWAVLVALGLAEQARRLTARARPARWAPAVFLVALLPFALNFRDASRHHGPDVTLARDFARALLESVPPGGILFTWGDNDTFPLWHAQVVDGIRPDVSIICLALAETAWYQRQLRSRHAAPVDHDALPMPWRDAPVPTWSGPLHTLDDSTIDSYRPQRADRDYEMPLRNGGTLSIPQGTPLYAKDLLLLAVVRENAGRRPIAWSVTAAQATHGAPVIQQGLALVLPVVLPDSSAFGRSLAPAPGEPPLDMPVTQALIDGTWHFGALLDGDLGHLEPNVAAMARTLALPYARLGVAFVQRADTTQAIPYLEKAAHLAPDQVSISGFVSELKQAVGMPFQR